MVKQILIKLIRLYQHTLSPDHGWLAALYPYGYCRHFPSCSEYACKALARYGSVKGLWLSAGRILRCNPYAKPSIDTLS